LLAAQRGKRTLLVSMDGKEPVSLGHPNLATSVYSTEEALREYIRLYVRVPLVSRLGVLAQTLDFVADAAPGVKEILAIGKVCYEVRANHYDLVVVDAESSGHIASQLATPRTIRSLAQVGMLREQTDWMIDMLSDAAVTSVVLVTTPEESPVDETLELADRIRNDSRVDVPLVVVNRMPPAPPRDAATIAPRITATLSGRHGVATRQVARLKGVTSAEVVLVARAPRADASTVVGAVARSLDEEFGEQL
jgi:anion-transporting  ArsA/GET3 family ATPase